MTRVGQLLLAMRIARRELRGGMRNARIFLACLALGIAAVTAIGTLRANIERGLSQQGAAILGGDAEMRFTYRFASRAERGWMRRHATRVSEIVDFRSMAITGRGDNIETALTQVKAVDDNYPLYGKLLLDPPMPLGQALAPRDGLPGAVMHPTLAARLALKPGARFRLGTREFRLRALIRREPDSGAQGFMLGPRTIVARSALEGSGLIGPGSLFSTHYRLKVAPDRKLAVLKRQALRKFRDSGLSWRDRRNAAPGIRQFVRRMGSFLVLVGLAGLAVGGVGISAAVRSHLEGKTHTIATLKTLGATSGLIFSIYFIQVAILTLLGIAIGLALGVALPLLLAPLVAATLPLPIATGLTIAPMLEAAAYGGLTALLFTLWPLARTHSVRPAALYRDVVSRQEGRPALRYLAALLLVLGLLVVLILRFSAEPRLAGWALGSISGALLALVIVAAAIRRLAARLARLKALRGHTALRLALGAVGGPASEALPVILSLGLGLSVLAAIGQIDSNLRAAITDKLPKVAPSFFFMDIQKDQMPAFSAMMKRDPQISAMQSAPMLRGVITRINGQDARKFARNHWVVRGDRGVTFAARMPEGTVLTAGKWWPPDYAGPPQISFAEEQAREIGLKLGDSITINILGRDITARITSFRVVDFSTAGIGFVMVLNPAALAGAPHTWLATIHTRPDAEPRILREIARRWPNITAIRVGDAITQVATMMRGLSSAISFGALVTLLSGVIVLTGAAAAGERTRRYEAAILKTLGATRARILLSFALRTGLLGLAAGLVAIGAGALAGWAVMRFVMESDFTFDLGQALIIVGGGALLSLMAGLWFALRPLNTPPARVLRAQE